MPYVTFKTMENKLGKKLLRIHASIYSILLIYLKCFLFHKVEDQWRLRKPEILNLVKN